MNNKVKKIMWLLLVFAFITLVYLSLQDPYAIQQSESLQSSSFAHILGTDYLGRDLWSRIVYGTLYSLFLTFLSLLLVVAVSLFLGGLAGFFTGFIDSFITNIADMLISLPTILLVLVFTGFISNSIVTVLLALTLSWTGKYIRYIRNLVLDIRNEEYILLASLRGSFGLHTLIFHIFPNVFQQLTSLFINDIGKILVSISGLSFLGIGVQPPTPELGTILYDGKAYFFSAPCLFVFPGIVLILVVISTQFYSEKFKKKYGDFT